METKNVINREYARELLKKNVANGVLKIPDDVTWIEKEAFFGIDKSFCVGHKTVDIIIPKSVINIGCNAFQNARFIKNLFFEPRDNELVIENSAFNFSSVENIQLPRYVTMESYAFADCPKLKNVSFVDKSSEDENTNTDKTKIIIGYAAFEQCAHLEEFEFPSDEKVHIKERAFHCSSIKELIVTSDSEIGQQAFLWCKQLKKVKIEGNTSIMYGAFESCINLESVKVCTETETGIKIGSNSFRYCYKLSKFSVKNGWIAELEQHAFSMCKNLQLIDISHVNVISDYSFLNCSSLESVTCSSAEKIGKGAFSGCVSLRNVELTDKLSNISEVAFYSTAIGQIYLSDNITEIGEAAFANCKLLESIRIPKLISKICRKTFSTCVSLGVVEFADDSSLGKIGNSAFEHCHTLKRIRIPSKVFKISAKAFYQCVYLKNVEFGDSEEPMEICDEAFSLCVSLDSITIPKSVSEIGNNTFFGCSNLRVVRFKGGWPMKMGQNVFAECPLDQILLKDEENND